MFKIYYANGRKYMKGLLLLLTLCFSMQPKDLYTQRQCSTPQQKCLHTIHYYNLLKYILQKTCDGTHEFNGSFWSIQ